LRYDGPRYFEAARRGELGSKAAGVSQGGSAFHNLPLFRVNDLPFDNPGSRFRPPRCPLRVSNGVQRLWVSPWQLPASMCEQKRELGTGQRRVSAHQRMFFSNGRPTIKREQYRQYVLFFHNSDMCRRRSEVKRGQMRARYRFYYAQTLCRNMCCVPQPSGRKSTKSRSKGGGALFLESKDGRLQKEFPHTRYQDTGPTYRMPGHRVACSVLGVGTNTADRIFNDNKIMIWWIAKRPSLSDNTSPPKDT